MRISSRLKHLSSPASLALAFVWAQACATTSSTMIEQQGSARGRMLPGTNYNALDRGLLDELNMVRSDPGAYASSLERDLQYYQGTLFRRPGDESALQTREGAAAVREAINALRRT
jgi:hypothetical protein